MNRFRVVCLIFLLAAVCIGIFAKTSATIPAGKPDAIVDLGSTDGVKTVKGDWRYSDRKMLWR